MPPAAPALFRTQKEARTVLQQSALLYLFLAFFLPYLCIPDYRPGTFLPPNIKAATDVFLLHGANILGFALQLEPGARGPYNQFVKCPQAFTLALSYPDRWFRNRFRMGRATFDRLVSALEACDIFRSTGHKPQRPVRYQLGCFLTQYGQPGSSALTTAETMGIGVGSVYKYCERVTYALRQLGLTWVQWGDRSSTKAWVWSRTRLAGCVGMLDGTLIRLTEPPRFSGSAFWCRKKFPAINVLAIVDHLRRFIMFDLGWPGSVPDMTIWPRSYVWQNRDDFFGLGEYVLADKGFASSPFVLRPFSEPECQRASPERRERMRLFNKLVSSVQVRVEQAYGLLKGRFPALKLLGTPEDIEDAYRTVEALLSVHNFCIDSNDRPELIPWFDASDDSVDEAIAYGQEQMEAGDDEFVVEEGDAEVTSLKAQGYRMREEIFNHLFPAP